MLKSAYVSEVVYGMLLPNAGILVSRRVDVVLKVIFESSVVSWERLGERDRGRARNGEYGGVVDGRIAHGGKGGRGGYRCAI